MESNSECTCGYDRSCISYLMQLTDPTSLSFNKNNAFASLQLFTYKNRNRKKYFSFEWKKPKGFSSAAVMSRKKDEQSIPSAGLVRSRGAW